MTTAIRRFALGSVLIAAATACEHLALEPAQVPSDMSLAPFDSLVTEGDQVRIRVTVEDQDGNVMAGPPSWAQPVWSLSDSAAVSVERDGTAMPLRGGYVNLTAKLAGLEAWTRLRINPSSVALSAGAVYLTQGIQNVRGTVPLVAGREALLRVFATGDETSFYQPKVRATFWQGDAPVHAVVMEPGLLIPHEVVEGRLDRSFNARIPAAVVQPGVELVVELDTEGDVPLAAGSATRVPADGRMPLDVRAMPRLDMTIVPVLLEGAPDRRVFSWTQGLTPESSQMRLARSYMPVADMTVTVHEEYYTAADLTTGPGWSQFLREISALWQLEGRRGYYYGVVVLPPNSEWGGLGYIGCEGCPRASVGRPSEDTFAHELGHNMSLLHAPCGGAGGPDVNYPYDGGKIGVWGYKFRERRLVDPSQFNDFMGYCNSNWVSDYHFNRAVDHRLNNEPQTPAANWTGAAGGGAGAGPSTTPSDVSVEPALLVWGSAGNGELLLEPAFALEAQASPPPRASGPYRLQVQGDGGRSLFDFGFASDVVDHGGGHFMFVLPYDRARDGTLERIVLSGPEGEAVMTSGSGLTAIVRDRSTGKVRAIVRNWTGSAARRTNADADVLLSDGLPVGGS